MAASAFDERFLRRAIEISGQALEEAGAMPYGAVVVRGGEIVGEGLNRAKARFDPTSHGEVEAIRDACARLECLDLSGCDLYSSCEPCPICIATMVVAGISRLFYGASLDQSRAVMAGVDIGRRRSVDIAALRRDAGNGPADRSFPSVQGLDGEAVEVLKAWAAGRPRKA